jgi:uncharacterized protein YbaR (Trm112 family)
MPVDPKLLQILRCPVTKQPLSILEPTRLQRVNDQIRAGKVHHVDGSAVDQPLDEALITTNEATLYRVDADIPIMLEDQSIATAQLEGF